MALSRITNPFLSSSGSGNASITSPAANTVAFTTATTERMRLDSSGNLGIGTTTPTYPLVVSNNGAKGIEFIPNSDTTVSEILAYNRSASTYSNLRYRAESHQFYVQTTERMRIDSNGNTLLGTTSATTSPTGYIAAANQFTFRNKLINGAMQVAQRTTAATTVTLNGPGYTTVDRWFSYQNGTAGVQTSQVAPSLSQFQYCLKWGRPSTNTTTGTTVIGQALETVNSIELQNSTVTLSFWAKCGANFSSSGSGIAVQMYTGTGADQSASLMVSGSWTGSATPINTSATLTTSWQRFVFTGTTGAGINQAGVYFNWSPTGTAGADDYVYITGLQLERGPVVTAYENRPYSTELALCQRYYEAGQSALMLNITASSTTCRTHTFFKVTKRISSSAVSVQTGAVDAIYDSGFSSYQSSIASATNYNPGTFTANAEL
jgi:hypothetical protein